MIKFEEIFNIIIQAFKDGDYILISFVLLTSVCLWLYNEFRKNYINGKLQDRLDIEKALDLYSKLYFGIVSYELGSITSSQLFDHIHQSISYLPKNIANEILTLDKETFIINSDKLEIIKSKIKNEINKLKLKQYTITTYDYDDNIFEQGSWFFTKNNFDSFIYPLRNFAFTIIGLLFMFLIIICFILVPDSDKLNFILIVTNLIISSMYLMQFIDLSMKKLLKPNSYLYFISLLVFPWVLFTFILKFKYPIINAITIISFTVIAFKKNLLRPYDNKTTD